jgi:hypothetical protein
LPEQDFSAKLHEVFDGSKAMIEVSNLTKRYAGRTAVATFRSRSRAARSSAARPERRGQKHDDADSVVLHAGDERHGARGGL